MYIPKELIMYLLGVFTFPIISYIVYVIKYKDEDSDKE